MTDTAIMVVLALNVILLIIVAYFLRTNGDNLYSLEKKIEAQEQSILEAIKAVEAIKVVETVREVETIKTAEPVRAVETAEAVESSSGAEQRKAEGTTTTGVSPQVVAVITAAIAAYLDDEDLDRHSIASIQSV